jgi:F0F1-type ATP synthase membrane subunit b/b'
MGFLDKAKGLVGKAEKAAAEHKDQLKAGLDKAEDLANKATKGKYKDKIADAGTKADGFVDGLKKD